MYCLKGKIVKTGSAELGQELEKTGYENFKIMEQLLNIDLEKISNSSKQEAIDRKKI